MGSEKCKLSCNLINVINVRLHGTRARACVCMYVCIVVSYS